MLRRLDFVTLRHSDSESPRYSYSVIVYAGVHVDGHGGPERVPKLLQMLRYC